MATIEGAPMPARTTRRRHPTLTLFAAAASQRRRSPAPPRPSRATDCRRSATSSIRRTSSTSTTSTRTRRRAGSFSSTGTGRHQDFDSFNSFILKGDAAQGLEYLFDSLMTRAMDEPDAVYGLVASSGEVAADKKSVVFKLRPEAKFADGTPVTADDVVFSFNTLKEKGHPNFTADATRRRKGGGDRPANRALRVQGRPRARPAAGRRRAADPVEGVLHAASRSTSRRSKSRSAPAPTRSAPSSPARSSAYKRRPDYWAKDLPVNRGRFNFDEVRYEYYRDRTLELEGLKAGTFDFREEFTSMDWATGYDVPAVKEGRLVRLTLPDGRPSGAQGFFINTRREHFKDQRVREALGLAFDFEWSNKNLFFELYKRTHSFFENSDMKAQGPPSKEELALLEPFKDKLAPEVFGEPVSPPVTDASGRDRQYLKRARDLLTEAGYGDGGKPLTVEILSFEDGFDRIILPYVDNLKRIGVNASLRRVDPAQYERRMKTFDFDMSIQRYALRLTPGVELKSYWGSEAAGMDGSFNLAGIKDPAVDALIAKVVEAKSRAELVTAARALDRVLRAGHYWVPQWYKAEHNVAFWNEFEPP